MPSRASESWTSSRAFQIRHLTVASVTSSESAISRVREPDDVAQQERHLQVDVEPLDRAPDRVDRLEPLERRVDDLERRDVVEIDDRARAALGRAKLVENAVLRHLEQPGRELRAKREARQPLEDAKEDLLRQILGERPVADHAQHVVVDRHLVRADDDRESSLIAPLRLPQYAVIRLGQRQGGGSIDRFFTGFVRDFRRSSQMIHRGRGGRESSERRRIAPRRAALAPGP